MRRRRFLAVAAASVSALALAAVPAAAQAADSYVDLDKIAADAGFQQRVDYAMVTAAIAIMAETVTSATGTRQNYARLVLGRTYNIQAAAMAVLSVSPVAGEATYATGSPGFNVPDADIATAVSSVWNSLAGWGT